MWVCGLSIVRPCCAMSPATCWKGVATMARLAEPGRIMHACGLQQQALLPGWCWAGPASASCQRAGRISLAGGVCSTACLCWSAHAWPLGSPVLCWTRRKDSYFFELGGRVLTVLGATLGAPQTAAVQSAHSIMLGTARIMCEWYMQSKADRLLQ